jgi:hypothetical protein
VTPARDGDVWKGIADGKQLIIEQLNAELDLARAEVAHWRECATLGDSPGCDAPPQQPAQPPPRTAP